ncbi:MAG TPA: hypothetical protein VGJ60_06820 [Chloroflexota bacterium]|jgi:hypothetical protein
MEIRRYDVLCAACSHNIRQPDGCDCHCHWDCERYGMHRWQATPEEIERRLLVCTRCEATMPLLEAN